MDRFRHFPAPDARAARADGGGADPALESARVWRLPEISLESLFTDDRFRIVPETMVDGLIVIDAAGLIRYVNPGCERLFGYTADDLIGRNVSILMPAHHAGSHDDYIARHRETRVKRIIGVGRELQGLKSDGSVFPMYLSVGEAETASGAIFVGIIYDLTDKKRAEEMILHHQKLDAIGQLSGGIAHDFNNILSVIGGNLEMIASADLPPATRRAVARAQDAAARAARITQRLLAFARKQPLSRQPVDINHALHDLSEMLHRSLGGQIEISMDLDPHAGVVETDIDQFETAVLNLAVNARDAMPAGGLLAIATRRVSILATPGASQEAPPGDYVRVTVSDTGVGMTPEVRTRAMEPFFTTKEVGSGTGLGLPMVYGFMKQIGGHVRLDSEPGEGVRVSLYFPRAEAAAAPGAAEEDASEPPGRGERVLVVEDDPDVRHISVSRLQSLGYDVKVAVNGDGALEALKADGDIDLALVDVVMPGRLDGHAVAEIIAREHPGVRVILTSGYSPRLASQEPGRPFLAKPATRAQLAQIVRRVLDA
jgi:PAS domain S-box-containing protein